MTSGDEEPRTWSTAATKNAAYEKHLITAPEDPRVQHLMGVLRAYQRIHLFMPSLSVAHWNGHWVLGSRNIDWPTFLAFFGVPDEAFEAASTNDDEHWYSVTQESLTMRHAIPAQSLDLRYQAALDCKWRSSPYEKPTSTHHGTDAAKQHPMRWRNQWLKFPVSLRCEWENKKGDDVTSITCMERHLVSPELINFRVYIYPVGGDVDDAACYLVPELGVTYLRVGHEMPPQAPLNH